MKKLSQLGFSDWFIDHIDQDKQANHEIARVIAVHKDSYLIGKGDEDLAFAELSGHLSYTAESSLDLPTTGDWVYADFYDDDSHAIIHDVISRRTLLKRKAAGKQIEFQLIAANIDYAFIIQSVDFNFNVSRLERYLVMVNEAGITPVILLSKCDLISQPELDIIRQNVVSLASDARVQEFSNLTGENIDAIKEMLMPASTYCLLGSSGVGKTTLLNSLLGQSQYETQTVSKKQNKGRHTTTSRELIQLDNQAMIIDTPGMRELGNMSVNSGIDETFSEIVELAQQCKFNDCMHTNEKGCAILAAMNAGDLSEQRYRNYLKLKSENTFYEMSYVEKRKKDKDFGKLIKNTMKLKKR